MKKLTLFSLLAVLLFSCGETPKVKDNSQLVEDKDTLQAIPVEPKFRVSSGEFGIDVNGKKAKKFEDNNFQVNYAFYESDERLPYDYQRRVNQLILKSMATEELSKITLDMGDDLEAKDFEKYIKSNYDGYLDAVKDNPEMFEWSNDLSISIDTTYKDFVVLEIANGGYWGGAHGSSNVAITLIEKLQGKELKLEDVFSNVNKLELIAEDYFREQNGMDKEMNFDEAGFWFEEGFKLNNNFYFTDKKLIFQYNQYEVAPYAAGMPTVEIPLDRVKSMLKISLDKIKK